MWWTSTGYWKSLYYTIILLFRHPLWFDTALRWAKCCYLVHIIVKNYLKWWIFESKWQSLNCIALRVLVVNIVNMSIQCVGALLIPSVRTSARTPSCTYWTSCCPFVVRTVLCWVHCFLILYIITNLSVYSLHPIQREINLSYQFDSILILF